MKVKKWQDLIAPAMIYFVLSLLALIVVYPFIHVIAVSFSGRGRHSAADSISSQGTLNGELTRNCWSIHSSGRAMRILYSA